MNTKVKAVLAEYAAREEAERQAIRGFDNETYLLQRETMLLGIGPETGQFLNLLIKASLPKHIVEVGTAFGYSTFWLAEAAASVGAIVTTYELAPEKHAYASEMIHKAGLEDHVRFVTGDAISCLGEETAPVDFALIDLWKDLYIAALDLLYPRLSPGAIVCADNMLFPDYQREAAQAYIAHARDLPGIESVTLQVGSGVEFSILSTPREITHPVAAEPAK
jgi:predicted O-methyltransferase YrrM